MVIPSQASIDEGVETRRGPPKFQVEYGEGIVQTTKHLFVAVKTVVVRLTGLL